MLRFVFVYDARFADALIMESFFWKFILIIIKHGVYQSGFKWWISQEFQILETKFENFRVSNFGPISLTFPFYSEFLYRITTELKRARYQNIKFSWNFKQFHAVLCGNCIYFIQIRYKMRILIENKIFRTLFRTWFGGAHRSWFRINLTFNTYPA